MKIAINSDMSPFSGKWIEYCIKNKIEYQVVNCFSNSIINIISTFDILLWNFVHYDNRAQLAAKQIVKVIEKMGVAVFPDYSTAWHYDDKIAQKYLLESIGAPLVKTYVFFDLKKALYWVNKTEFPKVFKLKTGAGSKNVRLVKTREEARKLCKIAFYRGFRSAEKYFTDIKIRTKKVKSSRQLFGVIKRVPKSIKRIFTNKNLVQREKGYIYFQDFIPGNKYDTRITIIGERAFGFTRNVRAHDFRASGSGSINYDIKKIDLSCVKIAFDVSGKLNSQSLAFDFISRNGSAYFVEISYCYQNKAIYDCEGYWDKHLNWHKGHIWPEDAIIEDMINSVRNKRNDN